MILSSRSRSRLLDTDFGSRAAIASCSRCLLSHAGRPIPRSHGMMDDTERAPCTASPSSRLADLVSSADICTFWEPGRTAVSTLIFCLDFSGLGSGSFAHLFSRLFFGGSCSLSSFSCPTAGVREEGKVDPTTKGEKKE